MNFIENLKEVMGSDEFFESGSLKFTVVLDKGGYFENVKGVLSYRQDEIVLNVKKCKIAVRGENLFVKKFCEGDLTVCGKINAVERL